MSGTGSDRPARGHRLELLRQTRADTLALVAGEPVTELPTDLYIPPEAMEVFLEAFEGPLDLLLYLIRRENLDILEISVADITDQYMRYIELMSALKLELAAEYLLMAALLAEIKSRMLLPRPAHADEDEDDPRAQLIRRLKEYERLKTAAEDIDALPRMERDLHAVRVEGPQRESARPEPQVDLKEVLVALSRVLHRADMFQRHAVQMDPLSVRERMSEVLARINQAPDFVPFARLFNTAEGRPGVIVTFLAVMELLRESLIEIVQSAPFAPIYVRAAGE